MQKTPTTPNTGVDERPKRVGQDRPSGTADQGISAEYIAEVGNNLTTGIDAKRSSDAEEDFIEFFRLLLEIDSRINPDSYDESTRGAECHDVKVWHVK